MHAEQSQREGVRIPRILVVEDNLVNRKLAVALVQKWGFFALVANDGQEALTILAQEHVDLILMDVQMPVLDGLKATRAIRAQEAESGEHLPIVALTAHAYTSDRARCMDAGMDEFLTKPVDHRDLYETILRLLPAGNEENPDVAVGSARGESVDPSAKPLEPQFDRQEVLDRVDGDLDLLEEIAALFLDSCEAWLEDLRRGVADSDAAAIEKAAHTLKGSAASFGARSLVEAALRVEKIGASLDLAEVGSAVRDLESHVGALTGDLRGFLREVAS
jgi:two-component system sensor histidine kinase/response regulator